MNNSYFRNNTTMLFKPEDGYNLGNMFQELYDPYKNYQAVRLNANSDKQRLMLELSRMSFAMHEVNLYLDVYPDDTSMIKLFNDYKNMYLKLESEYENMYGPINVCGVGDKTPFEWENNYFPWEVKNV